MRVLTVNTGSSSLKLNVLDDDRLGEAEQLPAPGPDFDAERVRSAVQTLGPVDAVGHRIVHGGEHYTTAVRIDDEVLTALHALSDLAPLHQPKALAVLDVVSSALPDTTQVACFDTAFHATMPAHASTYALPLIWREQWGLRRFGFHGLSHAYAARRGAQMLDRVPGQLRIVTCHLGAGASLAAVRFGRSVDTTMGFTPLEGLAMATRSGSVDPGVLLWVLEHKHLNEREIAHALENESGMLGLAATADMREVIDRAAGGNSEAVLALDVYLHRLTAGIAAMAAAMGGVDAVVWTGGVGEAAPTIRAAATDRLAFLGLAIDHNENVAAPADRDLSDERAKVATVVVLAREDLEIAREVRELLTVHAGI